MKVQKTKTDRGGKSTDMVRRNGGNGGNMRKKRQKKINGISGRCVQTPYRGVREAALSNKTLEQPRQIGGLCGYGCLRNAPRNFFLLGAAVAQLHVRPLKMERQRILIKPVRV